MKTTISLLILLVSFSIYSQQKKKMESKPFSTKDKMVVVYTTAENSSLRLSKTDNLGFSRS